MTLKPSLLVLLVPFAINQPGVGYKIDVLSEALPAASIATHMQQPSITDARLEGSRLIVRGTDFGAGAMILLNGKKQNTVNDAEHPSSRLITADAAKRVPLGEIVIVRVQNPEGTMSKEFFFFTGRVITLDDGDQTIPLKTGERFLLHLKNEPYSWTATVDDVRVIRRMGDSPRIPGSQGLFEALRPGRTGLIASGELPCHKVTPPCMAPTLSFAVRFVIQ